MSLFSRTEMPQCPSNITMKVYHSNNSTINNNNLSVPDKTVLKRRLNRH